MPMQGAELNQNHASSGAPKNGSSTCQGLYSGAKGLLNHENSKTRESARLASKQTRDTGRFHTLYEHGK